MFWREQRYFGATHSPDPSIPSRIAAPWFRILSLTCPPACSTLTDTALPSGACAREPVECPIDHRCLVRLRPERVLEEVTRIR